MHRPSDESPLYKQDEILFQSAYGGYPKYALYTFLPFLLLLACGLLVYAIDFKTDLQDKVGGLRFLVLQNSAGFVAQIQACDEEEDADTVDDICHLGKSTPESESAAKDGLRFLIVTYKPDQRMSLQTAIDALVAAGVVQFDCSDDITFLTV